MRLISSPGLGLAPLRGRLNYPKFSVTLIAKVTVALEHGGTCRLLRDDDSVPTGDKLYADDEHGTGAPRYESDYAYFKPAADVLVVGHFHAAGGKAVKVGEVSIGIDSRSVRMAVVGRRRWNGSGALPTVADAEPFSKLELRWDYAFGGEGSVHNPIGTGYLAPAVSVDKLLAARDWRSHPLELPRIELFDRPWTHPRQSLDPICPAPRARTWPIRRERIGTCDDRWLSGRWPWLPEDCDMRYFQAAVPSLQFDGYLLGNETMRFKNMHPSLSDYQTRLPGVRVIAAVQRTAQGNQAALTETVVMHLDTLWVDMDNETAQLVWRGQCATNDADANDIAYAWADVEALSTALSPAQVAERAALGIDADEAQWEIEREPDTNDELDNEGHLFAELPVSVAGFGPQLAANKTEPPSLEQRPHPAGSLDTAEAEVDSDLNADASERAAKQPVPWSRERLRKARQQGQPLEGLDLRGLDLSAEDFSGANLSGCLFSGARLEGARFCAAALNGVSLDGAMIDRVDFSDALLDDADLSRTRGAQLKLQGASMQRANLSHCAWPEAEFTKVNLELAYAADACFDGASFEETTLDEANLDGCSLERARFTNVSAAGVQLAKARLSYASFADCKLQESDFSEAVLTDCVFQECSLDDATLEKASANGVCLLRCTIARLRAAEADLSAATVVECHGEDTVFESAQLSSAVVSDCSLKGADLSGARLDHAHLLGCALRGAKLASSDLTRAFVIGCDCFEASFDRARLEYCDGSRSSFFRAEFLDANVTTFFGQQRDLLGTKLARRA